VTPAAAILLLAFGDVNLTGALFMGEFQRSGHDPSFAFARVRPLLGQAAIRVANLEGPLTFADWSEAAAEKPYRFRQLPAFAGGLSRAGFDVVLLGNNHIADAGPAGIADTERALRQAGLAWVPPSPDGPLLRAAHGYALALWNADLSSAPGAHPWAVSLETLASRLAAWRSPNAGPATSIVFVHLHDEARKPEVARALRAAGAAWVVFGGSHEAGRLEADAAGGVHTGLGDLVFGCECSDGGAGRAFALRPGPQGLVAEERVVEPGRAGRGFVADVVH